MLALHERLRLFGVYSRLELMNFIYSYFTTRVSLMHCISFFKKKLIKIADFVNRIAEDQYLLQFNRRSDVTVDENVEYLSC
jgi:hypothetical protein